MVSGSVLNFRHNTLEKIIPGRSIGTNRYHFSARVFNAPVPFFPDFFLVRPCLKNFNRVHEVSVDEAIIG